jgi:hypothetical protein
MTDYALYMCTTDGIPSLEAVASQVGISADDLDPSFGVVPIQPLEADRWRVAIRVDQRLTPTLHDHDQLEGPYADPPIEPQ